jgi:hypothetical protein
MIKLTFCRLISFLTLACVDGHVHASTVVVLPHQQGDSGNAFPFSVGGPGVSMRYQQVYDAAGFADVSQGCLIRALGFNIRSGYGSGSLIQDIQIDFSTISSSVDGLSPDFASNVGSDDAVGYGRGSLYVANNMPGAPSGFGVLVTLTTPFVYHPANGNLLMDVRMYQPASGGFVPGPFDCSTVPGDTVSRVWAFGVGSATGSTDTFGLITAFVVDPIPEPGSARLCIIGVAVFVVWRSRRAEHAPRGVVPNGFAGGTAPVGSSHYSVTEKT